MTEQEKIELLCEGIEIRHWFDKRFSGLEWEKLNRLIEIELLLEAESNK